MRSPLVEREVDRGAGSRYSLESRLAERATAKPDPWIVGEPLPGTRWVVQGLLGQGGMSTVLQVSKAPADILGAMKVMRPALAQESSWTRRFLAEARLLATVRHPNIVEVIDYDTLSDGTPFLVMELLQGQTLRRSLRAAHAAGVAVTARNVFAIISQLCEGLLVLHSQRPPIVHGDVKPENIFLRDAEHAAGGAMVKLLDFGLARAAGWESKSLLGTPRYMAPEQLRGEAVSESADQYSAALVAYEMMTGRCPWDVKVHDVDAMIDAHLRMAPAPPSKFCPWVPRRVDEAIVRALAKNHAERWASVAEFAERIRELEGVLDGSAYATADVSTIAPTMDTLEAGPMAGDLSPETEAPRRNSRTRWRRLDREPGAEDLSEIEQLLDGLCPTVPGRAPPDVMRVARAGGRGRIVVVGAAVLALAILVSIAFFASGTNGTKGLGEARALGGSPEGSRTSRRSFEPPAPPGPAGVATEGRVEATEATSSGTMAVTSTSAVHPTARPAGRPAELKVLRPAGTGANDRPGADESEWKQTIDDEPVSF
jgi:serine/threonine protein kinase